MAEDQQASQERTEQPTERRKQESRKKGQVPRSRELNTMLSLLVGAIAMLIMGSALTSEFALLVEQSLSFDRATAFNTSMITVRFGDLMMSSLMVLVPFFGVTVIGAFAGPLLMGGWSFSVSAMAFKFEKLDPVKGIGRLFSAKGLMELVKTLFKFFLVIGATVFLFYQYSEEILLLASRPPALAMSESISLLLWSLILLSFSLIFIVVLDVPFSLWDHNRQLKMTRQEVRDEMKETDGKPEVKSRIRSLQREISQGRMMQDVPKADVVITNPTHFSVALKYDSRPGAAPMVVAKGRDLVAFRIRTLAGEVDVPIFSAPPLARALYASTDIGQEIPQNLYLTVARVLAYVYQLKRAPSTEYVAPPEDLWIPDEYRDQISEDQIDDHE